MKYALVTGASSGIGKEFCKLLDDQGYNLILTARRRERLEELQKDLKNESLIMTYDLSKETEVFLLYDAIKNLDIEVLINNAGFGDCGYFIERDVDFESKMIQVNIKTVHILTKLILKDMIKKDHGAILNVASSAGFIPGGPYMATYYATKAYVVSLTRAINQEIKEHHSHVYIGCLCPGPVDTEFNQVASVQFSLKGISAKQCASYALKKMNQKKTMIIPGVAMKLTYIFGRFVPTGLYLKLVSRQQKSKIYRN